MFELCSKVFRGVGGFALALLFSLASGCDGTSAPTASNGTPNPLDDTPRANAEAEDGALWLTGELVAPQELYQELRDGYEAIRTEYVDQIPALGRATFVAPWVPGNLLVKLSEEAREALRRNEYRDLDDLNDLYRATEVDTSLLASIRWVALTFEGRLHPERLREVYDDVESLDLVTPNGRWNNARGNYPWIIENGLTFLFREGWGDCPAGCFGHRFWYFRVQGSEVEYVGTCTTGEPKPSWWDEAKRAYLAMTGAASN